MFIKINLLKWQDKKRIAHSIHYILAINSLLVLSATVLIVAILLFIGKQCMDKKIEKLDSIKMSSSVDQEIVTVNKDMNQVNNIQQDYVKWSRVLVNTFNTIPEGNIITNLNFDKENKKIVISGHAETRDDFLKLKDNWDQSDLVSDISSPISNLLHQTDVEFKLEGVLNL